MVAHTSAVDSREDPDHGSDVKVRALRASPARTVWDSTNLIKLLYRLKPDEAYTWPLKATVG